MAQSFDITSAVATVTPSPATGMRGEVPFTVKNGTGRRLRVGARVRAAAPAQEAWFRIAGEPERDLAVGEVAQYVVHAQIPVGTPAVTARFHLQIFSVDEPSEVYTDGPTVTLAVGASPAPAAPPRRRFPPWIPVAAVVVLVVGGVTAWLLLRGPTGVDVTGKTYAEAEKQLGAAKLKVRRQDQGASTPEDIDKVLRQDPPAGKGLSPGEEVVLFVGAPTVPPGLVGKTVAEAQQALASARLKAVQVDEPARLADELGKIMAVRPLAGQPAPGGNITLVVGVEPTVPDVLGKTLAEAEKDLGARGFSAKTMSEASTATPGRVIRQSPAAKDKIKPQSAVSLTIAVPPQLVAPVAKSCEATSRRHVAENKAFVEFSLPAADDGQSKLWWKGTHAQYEAGLCRRIHWANVQFTCRNGTWVAISGNYSWDALCHGNTGDNLPDIRVGVQR